MKTNYFEKEEWEREWIETAKDLLFEQWDMYYCDVEATLNADGEAEVSLNHSFNSVLLILLSDCEPS